MPAQILPTQNLNDKIQAKLRLLRREVGWFFYRGDVSLLDCLIVAIVGSRRPNPYAKTHTFQLARQIAELGAVVMSGGAFGVDIEAHKGAGSRTILVSPSGLGRYYPTSNRREIERIANEGLLLSEYETDFLPQKWTFLERNETMIALSDCVVVPQADENSGSMYSAYFAHKIGKPLFVLSHRIGESLGTQRLIETQKATPIVRIEGFLQWLVATFGAEFGLKSHAQSADSTHDAFMELCRQSPFEVEVIEKFGAQRLAEEQLNGLIALRNGRVVVLE